MQERVEILRRIKRQYVRDQLAPMGLLPLDGMVLHLLGEADHLRQEDIAHKIVMDKGAVARTVARLEKMGLLERWVSDQCRREKLVRLTSEGQIRRGEIQAILDQWNTISYQGFTPQERELYDQFLTRITQNVTQFKKEEQHG